MPIQKKARDLEAILRSYGKLAIAFSGGIDSALLLKTAVDALGGNQVLAATALAANFSLRETGEAIDFAKELGVEHLLVKFDPMVVDKFPQNDLERCYHCKKAIFTKMWGLVRERGFDILADGTNADDADDYRPGMRAVRELAVFSPLLEAGLGKSDIRDLSRDKNIPFWNKPSMACLASRIPYGDPINETKLAMVEKAEDYLFALGFRNIRVRHHRDLARIEVESGETRKFYSEEMMRRVGEKLCEIGFAHVTLDLLGYRRTRPTDSLGNEKNGLA